MAAITAVMRPIMVAHITTRPVSATRTATTTLPITPITAATTQRHFTPAAMLNCRTTEEVDIMTIITPCTTVLVLGTAIPAGTITRVGTLVGISSVGK